jgi:hypothetical protein
MPPAQYGRPRPLDFPPGVQSLSPRLSKVSAFPLFRFPLFVNMSKNPAGINPAAARRTNRTRAHNHAGNGSSPPFGLYPFGLHRPIRSTFRIVHLLPILSTPWLYFPGWQRTGEHTRPGCCGGRPRPPPRARQREQSPVVSSMNTDLKKLAPGHPPRPRSIDRKDVALRSGDFWFLARLWRRRMSAPTCN